MTFRCSIEVQRRRLDEISGNGTVIGGLRLIRKVNLERPMRLTVEKEALEGFLDLELGVEDDEPEGDGEDVVACSALEIVSEHV